jgi:hypothetical protein
MGNFTKKAIIITIHQKEKKSFDEQNPIKLVLFLEKKNKIKINKGKEAKIV